MDLSVAVAIVSGAVPILLWWLGTRKRFLVYAAESASLLLTNELESSGAGDIDLSLGGRSVDNPYLVTLTIACHSRKDIRETDFGGRPLLFHFGAPVVAARPFPFGKQDRPELRLHLVPASSHGPQSDMIQIMPSLIRKGRWCRLRVITEGEPNITEKNPIADVAVREGAPATPKRIYVAIGIQTVCLIFGGGIIANPHLGWPEIIIAIVLVLVATVTIVTTVIGGDRVMAWHSQPS